MYGQQGGQAPWGQGHGQGQQGWQQGPPQAPFQGPDAPGMGMGGRMPHQWDRPPGQQSGGPSGQLWDGPDTWQQQRQGGRPVQGFNDFDGPPMFGQQQPGPDMPWSQQQQQQMQLSQQGPPGWDQPGPPQYGSMEPSQQIMLSPGNVRTWVGTVTQLIPPNYGIVDGNAFYVNPVVVGPPPSVGDRVACEGIPNTDGGMYDWRLIRIELAQPQVQPPPMQQPPLPPPSQNRQRQQGMIIPHNRPVAGRPPVQQSHAQQSPVRSPSFSGSPAVSQPSGVPTRPLQGFKGGRPDGGAPGGPLSKEAAQKEAAKYNMMAPPTAAYTADLALARASAAMEGGRQQAPIEAQGLKIEKRVPFASVPGRNLDEEARKRSEAAVQQLAALGDPTSIGARLMGRMGFGAAGAGLGKAGQGISAPVEPVKLGQGVGLGFQKAAERRRSPDRRPGRPGRSARGHSPPPRRRRSRSRSRSADAESRSRSRSASPAGRGGRYRCDPPKWPVLERDRGVPSLSKRYRNLYIPGDLCRVTASWLDASLDANPLPLTHHVALKVHKVDDKDSEKDKDGEKEKAEETEPEAPSAAAVATAIAMNGLTQEEIESGRGWTARVMVMSGANPRVLHNANLRVFQHPAKKIHFLVGRRGKGDLAAIGGRWEPVDGGHPARDPSSLVATAIRTFRAATGVNLSRCSHWLKFAEFEYIRTPKDGLEVAERTVVFLVDAHAVAVPDQEAIDTLANATSAAHAEIEAKKALEEAEEELKSTEAAAQVLGDKETPPEAGEDATLVPAEMTVAALQEALSKRGMDTKWNPLNKKKELVDRLSEYVNAKKKEREALEKDYQASVDAKKAFEAAQEREKEAREAVKTAKAAVRQAAKIVVDPPATEMVEVRPDKDFWGRKEPRFGASALSLDELLQYDEDDSKEGAFEVAAFAELFREMLEARFGRGLARCLAAIGAKEREAKEKRAAERKAKKEAEKAAAAAKKEEAESGDKGPETAPSDTNHAAEKTSASAATNAEAAPAVPEDTVTEAPVAKDEEMGDAAAAPEKIDPADAAARTEGVDVTAMDVDAVVENPGKPEEPKAVAAVSHGALENGFASTAAEAEVEVKVADGQQEESRKEGKLVARDKEKEAPKSKEEQPQSKGKGKESKEEPAKGSRKSARGTSDNKSKTEKEDFSKKDKGSSSRSKDKGRDTKSSAKVKEKEKDQKETKKKPAKEKDEEKQEKPKQEKVAKPEEKKAPVKDSGKDGAGKTPGKRQAEGTPAAGAEHAGPPVKKAKAETSGSDAAAPAVAVATPEAPANDPKPAVQQKTGPAAEKVAAAAQQPSAVLMQQPPAAAAKPPEEPLFVACRFFDRECTGYIEGEDLEEILFMVSDAISRKRVQALVDAVIKRGRFSYTDHAAMAIPPAAVQGPPVVGTPGPHGPAGGCIAVANLDSSSSISPADVARMRAQLKQSQLNATAASAEAKELSKKLEALQASHSKLDEQRAELAAELAAQRERLQEQDTAMQELRLSSGQGASRAMEQITSAESALAKAREELAAISLPLQL
ncbi:probable cell division cycle and apoptosis regulator protein 1 [Coccomyxa sp. Obi]|nr:probable cell division cycle and apoptosis regulator protein 1 [Coccomyxa sp. Obi]